MQVWSICPVASAHKWDYSLNEWCSLPKANKSVIKCLGPWWQSLCWWQLCGKEEERITFTFHLALAWSPRHRGHLGWNATILPVIKLLIQAQCTDFHLICQRIHGLLSLHAAIASQPPIMTERKGEKPLLSQSQHRRNNRIKFTVIQRFLISYISSA